MADTYVFNGKPYTSLDEMPPDVRAQFESMNALADRDNNGMPEIMDDMMRAGANTTVIRTSSIVYEGKTDNSVNELPPEGRAAYEKAMGQLADNNANGVPDIVERATASAPNVTHTVVTTRQYGGPLPRGPQTGSSNLGPIIVLSIVCIGLAIILAIVLFLVFNKT